MQDEVALVGPRDEHPGVQIQAEAALAAAQQLAERRPHRLCARARGDAGFPFQGRRAGAIGGEMVAFKRFDNGTPLVGVGTRPDSQPIGFLA